MTPAVNTELEQRAINVIRGLCMDAPQAANSGHPGTGMALAPLAHVLWTRLLSYDAGASDWPDRDRFVLSAGHASILLYSMLHLTGYGLTLDDLRQFRQWGSRTPGHPEVHHTPGVEMTTGPLGQGFANSVGMAFAERWLRARFGPELVDHRTFAIASDGDLMEGVSHEAGSLAGHQRLGRLVAVYDDNHISIDGDTALAYSDDAGRRFEAYGWHVVRLGEVANDTGAIEAGLREAMAEEERPSLVILRSHIGWPSPKYTDTEHAHGNPLGDDEVRVVKEMLDLPPDETFWVPDDVLALYRTAGERGRDRRAAWEARLAELDGAERDAWDACWGGRGLAGWQEKLPTWSVGDKVATRKSSGACFQALCEVVPGLIGGGADLTGNTGTKLNDVGAMSPAEPGGRQLYFGVREHAMVGSMTGMALHGGVVPVGGTFFVFSDYCRPAVRLAAVSEAKIVLSFTHDSVGLGEDGPTHQPIEHLAAVRAIPDLRVIRPADANECAVAWRVAIGGEGPTALILTRQDIPVVTTPEQAKGLLRGAYVLAESAGVEDIDDLDLVLIGTGSEVSVCLDAKGLLEADGTKVRVVSMPSWELFELLENDAQDDVLPPDVPTLAVEAATSFGWGRFADDVVAIDRFGASAPGKVALEKLGYTAENVAVCARELLDAVSLEEDDVEEET
ncbi:MAG: transketolase [Acidimicrobiales bacterium]